MRKIIMVLFDPNTENSVKNFASILENYLAKRYNYKKPGVWTSGKRVFAHRVQYDIILSFPPNWFFGYNDCLIIVKIGFREKRVGNGSDFLRLLCNYLQKEKINHLGLEATNDGSIRHFAKKFGFVELENNDNWIAETKSLSKILK